MINYNRLCYEIKRDLTNFSTKISNGLKRPQQKFVHQMLYGIFAGNKVHLSEIAGFSKKDSCIPQRKHLPERIKESSKRMYEVPKFIFYALGYAIERVLSMNRKGINSLFPKKGKSQQLNLFEYFKIEDAGVFVF